MTHAHDGIHYYFAYFSHKNDKWILSNYRFLLNKYKKNGNNRLLGQYITSTWFNSQQNQDKCMKFIVFGVKNINYKYKVIDTINSTDDIQKFKNSLEFVDTFMCCKEITQKLTEYTKDKGKQIYEFIGNKNKDNKLILKFNYHNKLLLATLPEFRINL